jgi:predicted RNase H-like HicB family nuclease
MRYLVVIEKTRTGFSAYSPDLDGCVAVGTTREDVERNMREAIELHLEGLREEGIETPPPTASSTYLEIPA